MKSKQKNRKKTIQAWAVISAVAFFIMSTITIVLSNRNFSKIFDNLVGGERAVMHKADEIVFKLDDGIETKADANAYGNAVNRKICDEGFVLLKNENNTLPLERESKVSVFGKNSVNIVMSGSGSADSGSDSTAKGIYDALDESGFVVNQALRQFYENNILSGNGRTANPKIENNGNTVLAIGETPVSSYGNVRASYQAYSDAAIVVFSRICGEGFDLPRVQMENKTRHYLQLDANEEALIEEVTANFDKVIVVLNSANPMEIGCLKNNSSVDSVIWIGNVGAQGIMALGDILSGAVNPSGHLADTYAFDFTKDPVWQNFGDNGNENGDRFIYNGRNMNNYFVDYEESIYLGYRYYETKGLNDDDWYDNNVVYPFGYGLSYTTFSWDVLTPSSNDLTKDDFTLSVKVTNVGTVAGKDVVQIYATAPYYGGIEKSAKVLVGFEKTELLAPNQSQTLTITVSPYAMASFDDVDANDNGFCGYELEHGNYAISVSKDAHNVITTLNYNLAQDLRWDDENDAKAIFANVGSHLTTQLSRNDFVGTFPSSPTEHERTINEETYRALRNVSYTANPVSVETMPTLGAEEDVFFAELFGKDFYDPLWQKLLDRLTVQEMTDLQLLASFSTNGIDSIGKPKMTDADGPNGFTKFLGDEQTVYDTVKYCCEGVMASTFNKDLMQELGNALGNESIVGNEKGDGMPYTGLYAPAMNLHRGQFGGRNCEYFSEDPFLSGVMGAYEIIGAREKGVITYVKHFVGNEQETHRAVGGDCTFVSEQALRELYLKPFEYAVKLGQTKAIMTSFNRIGTSWTGGDYRLLTVVLRNEWGFHGAVITDFNTNPSYMNTKQMAYAGGTLDLANQPHDWLDVESATDVSVLRENTHETLYALVNSNVIDNVVTGYKMAYWRIGLIILDVTTVLAIGISGVFVFRKKLNLTNN